MSWHVRSVIRRASAWAPALALAAPGARVRALIGLTFLGVQLLSVGARAQGDAPFGKPPPEAPTETPAASKKTQAGDQVKGQGPQEKDPVVAEENGEERSQERPVEQEADDSNPPKQDGPGSEGSNPDGPASEDAAESGANPSDAADGGTLAVEGEALTAEGEAPAAEREAPVQSTSSTIPAAGSAESTDAGTPGVPQHPMDEPPPAGAQEAQPPETEVVGGDAREMGSSQDRVEKDPNEDPDHPSRFRTGLTVVPRLALTAGGWTQFEEECSASGRLTCDDEQSFGRREASGISLGVEGLYQLIPSLRLGLAAGVIPWVRGDGGDVRERFGAEAGLSGIVEGVVDVTLAMAVSVRGQVGASMLWTGGRAQQEIDRATQECDQVRLEGIDCLVEFGPFVAPLYGVGAGFLWPVSEHRLRVDLLYQFSKRTLYRQEAEASDSAAEARVTMDTSRLWLSLGFEI